jgi:hypothetical protein
LLAKVVLLNRTLVALALAGAGHVHAVAQREHIRLDNVAHAQAGNIREPELLQVALYGQVVLLEVALAGFVGRLLAHVAKTKLNGFVAVVFGRLLLDYDTGAGFNYRDGHYFAALVKNLRHTDFLAYDAFLHALSVPPLGYWLAFSPT